MLRELPEGCCTRYRDGVEWTRVCDTVNGVIKLWLLNAALKALREDVNVGVQDFVDGVTP